MTLADTNLVDLYYSAESVWGETPSSPAMTQVRYTGESLAYNKQTLQSEQIRSDRMRDQIALAGFDAGGDFNFELAAASFNPFLAGVMSGAFAAATVAATQINVVAAAFTFTRLTGSYITDGVVVGMWVRTAAFSNAANNGVFKVAAVSALVMTLDAATTGLVNETGGGDETVVGSMLRNGTTAQSFLFEKRFTDITQFITYTGMRPSTMNLSMTAQEIITGTFGFMGEGAVRAGATVSGGDTSASTTSLMSASANLGSITKDGAALATALRTLNLDINNNLRAQQQIGSNNAAGIGYGFFDLTGSIEAYFQDATLYDDLLNHTSVALSFRGTDDSGNVTVFTLPNVYFTAGSPQAPQGNADVMLPLEFAAVRDATLDTVLQIDYLAA